MGGVLGDILFLGIGIALTPLPILTIILLLTGKHGRMKAVVYLIGWFVGLIALVAIVFLTVSGYDFRPKSSPSIAMSWAELVAGIALLVEAYVAFRHRPRPDSAPPLPGWLKAIQEVAPVTALGAGLFFGLLSVKNLLFIAAAASAIGKAHLTVASAFFPILLFVIVASLGVATPMYIAVVKKEQAEAILGRWVHWLTANNSTLISLLCLLVGVKLFGQGLGGLL